MKSRKYSRNIVISNILQCYRKLRFPIFGLLLVLLVSNCDHEDVVERRGRGLLDTYVYPVTNNMVIKVMRKEPGDVIKRDLTIESGDETYQLPFPDNLNDTNDIIYFTKKESLRARRYVHIKTELGEYLVFCDQPNQLYHVYRPDHFPDMSYIAPVNTATVSRSYSISTKEGKLQPKDVEIADKPAKRFEISSSGEKIERKRETPISTRDSTSGD